MSDRPDTLIAGLAASRAESSSREAGFVAGFVAISLVSKG